MSESNFQKENNAILTHLLEDGLYKIFAQPFDKRDRVESSTMIECYLTPDCNQTCSYCYLCQHGDQLYPKELRNQKKILSNLKIFLNYCIEKHLNPDRFDLFSGEIWDTSFGLEVLSIVEDAVTNKGFSPRIVMIPSNCSFILNHEATEKIEKILENFKKTNTRLVFSCSNDGKYVDLATRPLNNPSDYEMAKGTDEYYEELFNFCKKWGFGFHPMVAAHGIESWKENFEWWYEKLIEYNFNVINSVMFLEVRNDNWTKEKIVSYLDYLNYSIDYLITRGFRSVSFYRDSFQAFQDWRYNCIKGQGSGHYSPLKINQNSISPGCTIHRSLVVRMGDLAIVPCHRTSYEEFIIGKYKVKNNKIIGVTAKNIQMANQIWMNNMLGTARCNSCIYAPFCMKGCYGSQFESNYDPFFPCLSVCELYKARVIFLYHKYKKINMLNKEKDKAFISFIESIKDTKEYEEWTKITMQII